MAQQYYVLGIGGTGMRCIEALIHLCAMGMMDDVDLHLLALDTDKNNGNFNRLKELKDAYTTAKGLDPKTRVALKDTFFSANIHYYEFSPDYERKSNFKEVFNYQDAQYSDRDQTDLADLVLDRDVEEFNLQHGYRAQTHLGSMMMYQSIVEAANSPLKNDLKDFVSSLITQTTSGQAKVFILGSVFGGTGASSIPIVPQALAKAAQVISNGTASIMRNAYFGSTLLTAYFTFHIPEDQERTAQRIIASSDKFALNSQAAMMFYDSDPTVHSTYQRFYMLGTNGLNWKPMPDAPKDRTITGGMDQKNDSHYIELLAACAALDFLQADPDNLQQNKANNRTDYLYRTVDQSGRLAFQDFVGKERQAELARKMGTLAAFGLLTNGKDRFVESVRTGGGKIGGFEDLDATQEEYLKKYFNLYIGSPTEGPDAPLRDGWLRQLHRSADGGDRMLLHPKFFEPRTPKALDRLDWNKFIYGSDSVGNDKSFSVPLFSTPFDQFKKQFLKKKVETDQTMAITNPAERLYKLVYDTLGSLYRFTD